MKSVLPSVFQGGGRRREASRVCGERFAKRLDPGSVYALTLIFNILPWVSRTISGCIPGTRSIWL